MEERGDDMEEQAKSSKSGRARKIVVRVLIALVALVVLAVAGIAFMFRNEIATVASIKKGKRLSVLHHDLRGRLRH